MLLFCYPPAACQCLVQCLLFLDQQRLLHHCQVTQAAALAAALALHDVARDGLVAELAVLGDSCARETQTGRIIAGSVLLGSFL